MGLRDDEQRALDAIEYQLLSEDPHLRDCFSALGALTSPVRPVNGWWSTARDERHAQAGPRRRTDNQVFTTVIELGLVIIAVVLVVMVVLGTVWVLAALSH
jgi:hypothetical protein